MEADNIIYEGPLNAGYEEVNFMSIMRHLYGHQIYGTQMAEFQLWFIPEYRAHICYNRLDWDEVEGKRFREENIAYELKRIDKVKVSIESVLPKSRIEQLKFLIQRAADHNPYQHEGKKAEYYHPDKLPESIPPFTSLPHREHLPSQKLLENGEINLVDKLE